MRFSVPRGVSLLYGERAMLVGVAARAMAFGQINIARIRSVQPRFSD
jgi:hypothetical protein